MSSRRISVLIWIFYVREERKMAKANYINGKWIETISGIKKKIINPANQEVIEEIEYGGRAEAIAAIGAADRAFPDWSQRNVYERAVLLTRLAESIRGAREKLARLLTEEVGKPLPEAGAELQASAEQFEWYAEEVKRAAGDVIPARMDSRRHMTIRHPVGPVAAISPWNFPVLLAARKLAPALAAGCSVICRPASQAPLTVMEVFRLIDAAGFPSGTANLVVGHPEECSKVFINDDRIKKISFTGSLEVGKALYVACAANMKKISLELGGHAPFIVMPDMSIEKAAEMAVLSKFRNMGQVCISPSRFYIDFDRKDKFEEEVVRRVSRLRIGNGVEPFVDVGPLFEQKRIDACRRYLADLQEKNGTILCGGQPPSGVQFEKGYFFEPTVVTDMTEDALILHEEPFVPILPVVGYKDIGQLIDMANNSIYGLAAYVLTNNLKWALEMADKLEAGIIGINDCTPAAAQCPFGGMKKSGVGREGWHQGLEAYFETKYVSIGL
jgi:succinate-semialdehyde dehydrogenase/glutarate-semialdehyde dehydrogenase